MRRNSEHLWKRGDYPVYPHTPTRGELTTGRHISSPHSCATAHALQSQPSPFHAHSVRIWVAAGCYTAGSLPAVPRFWPIVVRRSSASLAHEGQQPLAQEPLENRSHTHKRTSSLPQVLRSTARSCSFLHPWARKHNACRQSQKRSSGSSIQARYDGEKIVELTQRGGQRHCHMHPVRLGVTSFDG